MTPKKSKADVIEERLKASLSIEKLEVKNQSYLHGGHAGDDGSGESHFVIHIISKDLDGLSRVAQHRRVFEILGKDITNETHSISLKIKN